MKCLLHAFSVITGVPFGELDQMIGQKAETVIDNLAIGAARFRGLHIQEMIDIALNCGWAMTEIEIAPIIRRATVRSEQSGKPEAFPVYQDAVGRFETYLQHYQGIATCRVGSSQNDHAVAITPQGPIDPTGLWKPGVPIHIDALFILSRIHPASLRADQQAELARLQAEFESQASPTVSP